MISSGMKRGLAATAVSALAVAGLPFLASSASAATGDSIAVGSQGPIRNGNAAGGTIVLKTKGVDPTKLELANTALTGSPNSPSQTVAIVGTPTIIANGADGDSNKTDGLDEITMKVSVTTPGGADASFAVYEDEDNPADPAVDVDASEARAQITVSPTGAPASVEVTPESQTTAANVASSPYTVTAKDASGKVTQLSGAETFVVDPGTTDVVATGALNATTMDDGVATFTATAPTAGTKAFTVHGATGIAATITDNASLTVIAQATIDEDEFDIATGADTWSSTSAFGDTVEVRVDQGSVTFNFASKDGADLDTIPDDANKLVLFTVTGAGNVKFDGQTSKTYPVQLDANGKGSLTVTPTGVVENSTFTFASAGSGIDSTTVKFTRPTPTAITADAAVYVAKVGGPATVTVTAKDQFGNPIGAPAQVSIVRGARNNNTETARQTVDANGKATFTLPDAGTTPGTETFTVRLYDDQFDASPQNAAGGVINYTADGLGGDFTIGGVNADGTTTIKPVTDDAAGVGDSVTLNVAGGTANSPATISVDNGALVLSGGTSVDKGAASRTITLDGTGAGSATIVGTKTGVVTATITSGGRTKTVKFNVTKATDGTDAATSRNVALKAPEKANAGSVAVFTATVTDAFGNPVAGVPGSALSFTVSGPANLQSSETVTDANGEIEYSVILTDNANSAVTGKVVGTGNQFGAAANQLTALSAANSAPGFAASVGTSSASIGDVVNIEELKQAVADAQKAVDEAQDNLTAAQGDLTVAEAQKAAADKKVTRAQKDVKAAKNAVKKAKKKHKGVAAAQKNLRDAKNALADAKGDRSVAAAAVSAAQTKVDAAQTRLDNAEADLAAAQAALDEAQDD